jgi:hypothetical protein
LLKVSRLCHEEVGVEASNANSLSRHQEIGFSDSLRQLRQDQKRHSSDMAADIREEKTPAFKNYKGFVAGVFSGIAKLSGRTPFIEST